MTCPIYPCRAEFAGNRSAWVPNTAVTIKGKAASILFLFWGRFLTKKTRTSFWKKRRLLLEVFFLKKNLVSRKNTIFPF